MSNITLDAANFSEQLGLYDFFNVIISGAVFIFGLCTINSSFCTWLLGDINVVKGLGIVLLIYIIGLVLQEIAYWVDKKGFRFYEKMSRGIIKDTSDKSGKKILTNDIIDNPLLVEQYRKHADVVLGNLGKISKKKQSLQYNSDEVNGFFFSICQYYVAINGKDRKVEKMRALFSMSKILMVCFAILAISALFIFQSDSVIGIVFGDKFCSCKIIVSFIFTAIAILFYFRTKKVMRRFLLILLGTYDAIIRLENNLKT